MQKPSNAKGTRDFSPEVVRKRNYILNTIKEIFEKYGFVPLQTPALENLSTLTGKYGDEGDKLLFKILNSGEIASSINTDDVASNNTSKLIQSLSEKGLRYDLTVPFARYVVQHRNEINLPFRRYQIQEVWRADKPQKGRYREFTQCDADCIGSGSMLNEADLIFIYDEVFSKLGFKQALLKLNHRKLLEALVEVLQLDFPVTKFTSTLDKLDKIGREGVQQELAKLGVDAGKSAKLFDIIGQFELNTASLDKIAIAFDHNTKALQAIDELKVLFGFVEQKGIKLSIQLDLSLARGLDYYTGCIFEALIPDSGIGSVSGGGRYDDLTSVFGMPDMSGVGISFGIDRLYDIMEAQQMFPKQEINSNTVLLCHFHEASMQYAVSVAAELRAEGIACMVYPDVKRLQKQMDFANKEKMKYCIIIGEDEMTSGVLAMKDMESGQAYKATINDIIKQLKG